MATTHNLALDIPDTACETIIRIVDASIYAEGLPVTCGNLQIYMPGFTNPVSISDETVETGNFALNLNAETLGLIPSSGSTVMELPDGLYTVKYSVCPIEDIYVQYYHLRMTCTMNSYYREICKVQLQNCEPTPEQHQKMHDLRYIKMFLDAAKAKAEYCHSPKDAIDMFEYAKKLLKKYQSGCCTTCATC
jgi:hypothetical protein